MKHHTIVTILGFLGLTIIAQVSTSQQTWRTVAPMNTPRFYFSMVPLQNGTVLAIGGEDVNDNPIGSCELYDPASGIWTYTGSLAVPRGRGCAVVLSSGKVAVFGGQVSASVAQTDQIEVYDPATKTWSSGGHLLLARQNETATYVNDSSIVIIGGLSADGTTASCEVYNSLTMSSRAIASMHQNRHDHMSLLLSNSNNILVAGGRDGGSGSRYFSECEMYDQENDVWTVMTPMQQARIMGVLAQFPDGSILAAGGRNTPSTSAPGSELLDTASLQWTTISPMLQPCTVSGNVMLPDARYLMTGGQIGGVWSIETDNITTPTCEWYDRPNQRWYYAPTLNLSRDKHVAVFLHQGVNNSLPSDMVMAAGGLVGIPIVDSFQHMTTVNPYITNTVEVLDVSPQAMGYYIAHQPTTAGVGPQTASTQSHFEVRYDADFNSILFFESAQSTVGLLEVYDSRGARVVYLQSNLGPGPYEIRASQLSLQSGVYFVRMTFDNLVQTAKLVIAR